MVLILAAVFLTILLIIFFCLRQNAARKGDDDIPYFDPAEFSGIALVGENAVRLIEDATPAELEDISAGYGGNSMIRQPFAFFMGNPELLQGIENQKSGISSKVIYEHNGIHYINRDAFINSNSNTEREINNNFAKLVESVVNKT